MYTTASALGDMVGAIQTLPGVATVGEDGRLFVRGGNGNELRMYVNGQPVGSPYNASVPNVPTRGRFSPALFSGFNFSSGAYSAEWGEALSGVLALETKNLTDAPMRTDLSLMSVGASASHQQPLGKGGVVVQADYLNLTPYMVLVPQQFTFHKAPRALGGAINWQQPIGTGNLSLFVDGRNSSTKLTQPDITQAGGQSTVALQNSNFVGQLGWKQALGNWGAVTTTFSASQDDTQLKPNGIEINTNYRLLHLKTKLESDLSQNLSLTTGLESERIDIDKQLLLAEKVEQNFKLGWYRPAAFTQLDWQVNKRLAARAGTRLQHSTRNNRTLLMPRLALAYDLQNTQTLSLAAGTYSQEADTEWLIEQEELTEARSTMAVASYQYQPEGRLLRAEVYYKQYEQLPLTFGNELPEAEGNGWASGAEVFWRDRKSIRGGDYWIGYSYVDSRRQYADFSEMARPTYAVQHNLNMVYKHFVKKLRSQVGGSFSLASGRPYEDPNTEGFMNETAPVQQNLSLNWAFLWKENLILYAAATNVLGGGKAFTYKFSPEPNLQGIYERQAIGSDGRQFFFVGLFFTLSHEKANQLERL